MERLECVIKMPLFLLLFFSYLDSPIMVVFLKIIILIHIKKKVPRSLCYVSFNKQLTYFISVTYLGYNGIIQLEIFHFIFFISPPPKMEKFWDSEIMIFYFFPSLILGMSINIQRSSDYDSSKWFRQISI